jgi:hypothetical protein
MSDPHLVYLFKLAKRQGFIFDLYTQTCSSECGTCPASPACDFIGVGTATPEAWLANYHIFYVRADFSPSITTILDQHPEILI